MVVSAPNEADPVAGADEPGRRRPFWSLPRIFLSYRRADTQATTRQLREALTHAFGPRAVFRDVESIAPGDDYNTDIERSLRKADVQLVIIGRSWLTVTNPDGTRRLDDPGDTLAREIELGLSLPKLRVIPVIVDDALLPTRDELPERIRPLLDRNGRFLRDTRWDDDVAELADRISGRRWRIGGVPRPFVAAGTAVLVAAAAAFAVARSRPPGPMDAATFNVVVARFQAVDGQGRVLGGKDGQRAADLGRTLATSTARAHPDLRGTVQFWSGSVPAIEGSDDQEREASADRVLLRRNANLVVYGQVMEESGRLLVSPTYFADSVRITNDLLAQLLHTFRLVQPDPFLTSATSDAMAEAVGPEVSSLVRLTGALTQFRDGRFKDAAATAAVLDDPQRAPGWHAGLAKNPQRQALVAYIRAVAALAAQPAADAPRSTWYAEAERFIDAAAVADPTFLRAQIVRAQIDYLRGRGSCTAATVDAGVLAAALDRTAKVASASKPVGEDRLKAQVLALDIESCRAAARVVDEAAALRWAGRVLEEAKRSDSDAGAYAAIAHREIGWDAAVNHYDWKRAESELQRSIELMNGAVRDRLTISTDPRAQIAPLEARLACIKAKQALDESFRDSKPDATPAELQAFRSAKITDAPCP